MYYPRIFAANSLINRAIGSSVSGSSFATLIKIYNPILPIIIFGAHIPMIGGYAPVSPKTLPMDNIK